MNLERWTRCLLRGHGWARTPYPGSEGAPDAFFLRCSAFLRRLACGFEDHHGTSVRPTGAGL